MKALPLIGTCVGISALLVSAFVPGIVATRKYLSVGAIALRAGSIFLPQNARRRYLEEWCSELVDMNDDGEGLISRAAFVVETVLCTAPRIASVLRHKHEPPVPPPVLPALEMLAADLRRLDRQRLGIATHSKVWHAAVLLAYDDRLRLTCQCLGIQENLNWLDGIDLELERLRVEGMLGAEGLWLRRDQPEDE